MFYVQFGKVLSLSIHTTKTVYFTRQLQVSYKEEEIILHSVILHSLKMFFLNKIHNSILRLIVYIFMSSSCLFFFSDIAGMGSLDRVTWVETK